MKLRTFLLTLCALPWLCVLLHGQVRHITIDRSSPAFLFADSAAGAIHVITAGIDNNFNGILEVDSGDVSAKWFVLNAATEQIVDTAVFGGFFSSFPPARPAVDLKRKRLYIPMGSGVREFDIDTREVVRQSVTPGFFAAASFDTLNTRLILAERTSFTEPGRIVILGLRRADTVDTVAMMSVGMNPSMAISRPVPAHGGTVEYYMLNEGSFSATDASISYLAMQNNIYPKVNDSVMAGGAMYIAARGDTAYVLTGGGHKVYMLDTKTHKDLPNSPLDFGESGPDGLRLLDFHGDSILLIGTLGGDIHRVRIATGEKLDTIKLPGRVESMVVRDSLVYVAIRANFNNAADSLIAVVNLNSREIVDTVHVKREPVAVFLSKNGDVNVIAFGSEDSVHWWHVIDRTTNTIKASSNFGGVIQSIFRFAYDPETDTMYTIVDNQVYAIPGSTGMAGWRPIYTGFDLKGQFVSVSQVGDYLVAFESGNNHDRAHLLTKAGELLGVFATSPRPTMAAMIPPTRPGALAFYVLDRGPTGARRSHLDFIELDRNIISDSLGRIANHIVATPAGAFVTLNGSHEVASVRFDDWTVHKRVSTSTTSFDGPRESMPLDDDRLLVSTYAGDVRVILSNGYYATYPTGGKSEGMVQLNGKVFIAQPFAITYAPDSTIAVFGADSLVASVERVDAVASATMLEGSYPNPASSETSIRFAVAAPGHVTLTLHAITGEQIETLIDRPMEAGSYSATLRTATLPTGSYIYTLRAGRTLTSKILTVTR